MQARDRQCRNVVACTQNLECLTPTMLTNDQSSSQPREYHLGHEEPSCKASSILEKTSSRLGKFLYLRAEKLGRSDRMGPAPDFPEIDAIRYANILVGRISSEYQLMVNTCRYGDLVNSPINYLIAAQIVTTTDLPIGSGATSLSVCLSQRDHRLYEAGGREPRTGSYAPTFCDARQRIRLTRQTGD